MDVKKVNETKEHILNMIRTLGPSFPTRVSRETSISPLFVSALLAELVAEQKLVMSNMKVGSSPLYFIKGQEHLLENFSQYLNSKEREAMFRLKEQGVLNDELEEPAIRVALRKIRDFALPMNIRDGGEDKLFWRFFSVTEGDANARLKSSNVKKEEIKSELVVEDKIKDEIVEKNIVAEEPKKRIKKSTVKKDSAFGNSVREYLSERKISIVQELAVKSKEFHARVEIEGALGKQEFYLIAKDKKKITEDDLSIALHKSQAEKMPSFLLGKGELDKDARPYLEQWKNLIKYEKLKV